jgi:putative Holliday junction resolvase
LTTSPGRAVGVDLGARRVGLAISDADRTVASPERVLTRSGDEERDHRELLAVVGEWEATLIVVGLPLSLDGSVGPAAEAVLEEVERLRRIAPVPVDTYDERLTTVSAERSLAEQQVRGKARRRVVDKVAAAILLQAWLDQRPRNEDT